MSVFLPRRSRQWAVVMLALVLSAPAQSTIDEPFAGIRHTYRRQQLPRPVNLHVLEIDLTNPGIHFRITPRNAGGSGENVLQTVRNHVTAAGAQVGINASFHLSTSDGYRSFGLVASAGDVYSPWDENDGSGPWPAIGISADNVVQILNRVYPFITSAATVENATPYNAVSGNERIVVNGRNTAGAVSYGEPMNFRARTCIGITDDHRLVIATADEAGGSTGMQTSQMADVLIAYGVVDGINLDGGGSTTLVFADPTPRVVNTPTSGERSVATHLAIFADPATTPVDLVVFSDAYGGDLATLNDDPTASSRTQGILPASSNRALQDPTTRRGWIQRITILDDPTISTVPDNPGGGWIARLLSGSGGSPANNVARPARGFIGLRARTRSAGIDASIVVDAPDTGERSQRRRLTPDGEWHVYEWNVTDPAQWDPWLDGHGSIDDATFTLDSVQFFGPNADATVDVEWVAHDANRPLAPFADETDSVREEILLSDDFATGREGWHASGAEASWNQTSQDLLLEPADDGHILTYFPTVALEPGEEIELTATVTFEGLPVAGNSRALRCGFFDSNGATKIPADAWGNGSNHSLFNAYLGYRVDYFPNLPTTANTRPIRYVPRNGVDSGNSVLLDGEAYGENSAMTAIPLDRYVVPSGVPHQLLLSIQRTPKDELVLTYSIADSSGIRQTRPYVIGTHAIAVRYLTFDTIALGTSRDDLAASVRIDNVRVVRRTRLPTGSYAAWREAQLFTEQSDPAQTADPDDDGTVNLAEFAFAGDPLRPDAPAGRPTITEGEAITFLHRRRGPTTYTVLVSEDLMHWRPVWSTSDGWTNPAVRSQVEGERFDTVTIGVPSAGGQPTTPRFWRVDVTDPQ